MTALTDSTVDVDAIRNLYSTNSTAKLALDYFASRERNSGETTVDRLHHVLAAMDLSISYPDVRDFLRELADLKCGEYRIGRRGWSSRLIWAVSLISLGQAAAGNAASVEELTREEAVEEADAPLEQQSKAAPSEASDTRVSYPLRPDRNVEFSLPKDLTMREAQRLADFIRTLPFDSPPSP